MFDQFGRELSYLRLSVTDRCNLRCSYCMPRDGAGFMNKAELLTSEEIIRLVRILTGLGVSRLRLTGGEPLLRSDIIQIATEIKTIPGITFLGLTTNGILLGEKAHRLLAAGVDGLNISLDSLDDQRYEQITGSDALPQVKASLEKVLSLPFKTIKINCVLTPTSLESDWLAVVGLAKTYPLDVRLIEWMPLQGEKEFSDNPMSQGVRLVQQKEALAIISRQYGQLHPVADRRQGQPARYWQIPGFKGRIGVISSMSHPFCSECNRLRVTANGDLKLCLFYDSGIALKDLLRQGLSDEEIIRQISEAVKAKPKGHRGRAEREEPGSTCPKLKSSPGLYRIGG